jgi:hypothetical protein
MKLICSHFGTQVQKLHYHKFQYGSLDGARKQPGDNLSPPFSSWCLIQLDLHSWSQMRRQVTASVDKEWTASISWSTRRFYSLIVKSGDCAIILKILTSFISYYHVLMIVITSDTKIPRVWGSVTNNNGFWIGFIGTSLQLQPFTTAQIYGCLRLAPFLAELRVYSLPQWVCVSFHHS